jgi:hypothetical protein
MNTPWIMFYNQGQVMVDVTIKFEKDPYNDNYSYYITPRYGKVSVKQVIEVRNPAEEK